MGYCIPIAHDKVEKTLETLESMGLPVLKTENRPAGTYYFCRHPKRPRTTWVFCITPLEEGRPRFFKCGLSQFSKYVVKLLTNSGVFEIIANGQEPGANYEMSPPFHGRG